MYTFPGHVVILPPVTKQKNQDRIIIDYAYAKRA